MARRHGARPWYRGRAGWGVALALLTGAAALFTWPRGPVYADYADGRRPTVVFVWSDPTPHHPDG